MASLALPKWTSRRHPIVHGETRHWRRSRVWRAARYVLWGGSLLFLAAPLLCTLLVLPEMYTGKLSDGILLVGGTFTLGLAVVSALAGGLNNLLAGLLGATLIARERECQSWPFLRLTTLTSLEIVGGKFTALLYTLANPLHFVIGLRLLALLAGALTAGLAALAYGLTLDQILALWSELARQFSGLGRLALQWSALVGVPLALAGWLFEPYFSAVYAGAVGLAASSLARSRGAGIVLTVAVHFGLGLGVYAPVQQFLSVGAVLLLQNGNSALMGFVPALLVVLPVVVQGALQVVVVAACLGLALIRAERLTE